MLENRKREIRKKADSLRGECKVGRYGIIDLFRECEHLGYMLLRYPLDENADLGLVLKKMMIPLFLSIPITGCPDRFSRWRTK